MDISDLIDKPFIFGRRLSLWMEDNWQVEPISRLILKADGSVDGHRNPNESRWKPYRNHFAFITNYGRHTSHWLNQTTDGIWLGRLNGCWRSPVGLCLVPDRPISQQSRIVVLLATCMAFYTRSLPRILPQLLSAGFEKSQIKIVVNAAPARKITQFDGCDCCFTQHNAWEYSSFYESVNWDFDFALAIPDTVTIDKDCLQKLRTINGARSWEVFPAMSEGTFAIGLVSRAFVIRIRQYLKDLDGMSKMDAVNYEAGGGIWQYAQSAFSLQAQPVRRGDVILFEDGVVRRTYYFESLGISKHVNWDSIYRGDYSRL